MHGGIRLCEGPFPKKKIGKKYSFQKEKKVSVDKELVTVGKILPLFVGAPP
jgi:hypothetical protein